MNRDELRELWCRFLGGEPLGDREAEVLLEVLHTDDQFRDQLLQDALMDGMLRGLALGD